MLSKEQQSKPGKRETQFRRLMATGNEIPQELCILRVTSHNKTKEKGKKKKNEQVSWY